MEKIQANLTDGFYVTLTNDAAKEVREELVKLVKRTFLSLAILFLFVWIVSRSRRYLSVIAVSLFANVLISVIFYYLFDVELNLISLAGVAVSFGIMIDTVIVMVDHYSYYHDRKAFSRYFGGAAYHDRFPGDCFFYAGLCERCVELFFGHHYHQPDCSVICCSLFRTGSHRPGRAVPPSDKNEVRSFEADGEMESVLFPLYRFYPKTEMDIYHPLHTCIRYSCSSVACQAGEERLLPYLRECRDQMV